MAGSPQPEPTQPVALTLASRLQVAWQVESQAPEVAQPEVLGLASLGTGALLLLGPQARPRRYWVVCRVLVCPSGPSSSSRLVEGESRRVWPVGPSARGGENSPMLVG